MEKDIMKSQILELNDTVNKKKNHQAPPTLQKTRKTKVADSIVEW